MTAPARTGGVALAFGAGALAAVGIGVYGRVHQATFFAFNIAGFSSGTAAKAWLATLALVLAVVQVVTGRSMYSARPWPRAGVVHRWSGRIAVLVTLPVAAHCLYAFGFEPGSLRVLVHSLAGCFFYGVFVAKMLLLRQRGGPSWGIPVLGGSLFTALVVLWLTAAGWFFATSGLTF